MIYFLFILYVFLASSGLILFKIGSSTSTVNFIKGLNISFSLSALIGMICYFFSFGLWLYIVSKTKLSWAFPLSVGLINTVILIASSIIFKEQITWVQIVGVLLITAGLALIGIKGGN